MWGVRAIWLVITPTIGLAPAKLTGQLLNFICDAHPTAIGTF